MPRSKIDLKIESYQLMLKRRKEEGPMEEQSQSAFDEELHWLSGVIYGLKTAKNA